MKFLCVECDAPMKLQETRGPDEGSMAVIFGCPRCGKGVAMLTNPMETQMVRSLGVKIGGAGTAAEPMGMVKSSLAYRREEAAAASPPEISASIAGEEKSVNSIEGRDSSGCPFSGAVSEAFAKQESGLSWTSEARARLERIPAFVRPMVQKSIEAHAREKGLSEIDGAVMDEMKDRVGM